MSNIYESQPWNSIFETIPNPLGNEYQKQEFSSLDNIREVRKTSALIVVDNQNGFLDEDGWGVQNQLFDPQEFGRDKAMESIKNLYFWAGVNDVKRIFLQFNPSINNSPNVMSGIVMSDFDKDFYDLKPSGKDVVFQKGANSGFDNPELLKFIVENNLNHLIISGFFLGACVSATASDAIKHNLAVTLPVEANSVHNKNPSEISQESLKKHYLRTHFGKERINVLKLTN